MYAPQPLGLLRVNGSIDEAGLLTHGLERGKTQPTDEEITLSIMRRTAETHVSESSGAASSAAPSGTPGGSLSSPDPTTTVTGINGATGAITVEGTGGIAVSLSGDVVTIDGSAIEGGGGETIAAGTGIAVSVSGSTATVGIADGGVTTAKLAATGVLGSGVASGSFTNANITVGPDGRVTEAANGSAGSGGNGTAFTIERTQSGSFAYTAGELIHIVNTSDVTAYNLTNASAVVTVVNARTSGTITLTANQGSTAGTVVVSGANYSSCSLAAGASARFAITYDSHLIAFLIGAR